MTIRARTRAFFPVLLTGSVFSMASFAQSPDDQALIQAAQSADEWLSYGRDYGETRFSPLDQITADNVSELGLAWHYDTGHVRGHEATPLVSDGVMYFSLPWSEVVALDARTGRQIWRYDPQVDRSIGWKGCCDVVNRGVALYEDRVYLGAFDGRLIALNAKTGEVDWQVQTTDPDRAYTITGAPRVVDGKVVIGNGGAEMGARGYVTAYDAHTGADIWRFWIVPGNPAEGFENPDMEMAAETWSGEWWTVGGGGNAWDAMAYDPEARLLYIGTGNGSPWSHDVRSEGVGDNLFLSSIVALHVDNGRVAWHYQTTPADNWDYTAVQHMILTELEINGVERKVIMQAPKNGFFYVLDRLTGELISADPYAELNWASGVDLETGRPIETPQARYDRRISMIMPGPTGAHNWHPMSWNPDTGLMYIPTLQGTMFPYSLDPDWEYEPRGWNLAIGMGSLEGVEMRPDEEYSGGTGPATRSAGALLAWDPLAREPRWQVDYDFNINGGILSTAGNLVFQGAADGYFRAFAADDGRKLLELDLGVGVMAAPMTYRLDGEQYVSVLVGWGGSSGLIGPNISGTYKGEGRLWTFKLGGEQNFAPVEGQPLPELTAIPYDDDPAIQSRGADMYSAHCQLCHGLGAASGGAIADLRYSAEGTYDILQNIVRDGVFTSMGMPNLSHRVSEEDVEAIKHWLLAQRAALMED